MKQVIENYWKIRLFRNLLRLFCHPDLLEEIEGDLEEAFQKDSQHLGVKKATWNYILTVLTSFRPYMFLQRNYIPNSYKTMFNSTSILSTIRVLKKQKTFTFLHVTGLTIGIACALLVGIYVSYELSYSTSFSETDNIYRLNLDEDNTKIAISPNIVGPLAKRELPATESFCRMYVWDKTSFTIDGKSWVEPTYCVDSSFLEMFSWETLAGNPDKMLKAPKTLVLTESTAEKYFRDLSPTDVVGQTLMVDGKTPYLIEGVIKDPPANSDFSFTMLSPFYDLTWAQEETWGNANYQTFVKLIEGVSPEKYYADLTNLADGKQQDKVKEFRRMPYLQPFQDIHLSSGIDYDFDTKTDSQYLYTFAGIALLILVIACINYINLSTARATERAREVGVRKVLGAHKSQLFFQFFSEALLIVLFSFALAIFLVWNLLPSLNSLIDKQLSFPAFFNLENSLWIAGGLLGISLLSGAYPSLLLTSFRPLVIMKKNYKASKSGVILRKSLVTVQFAASVFLLLATFTVGRQLAYIQEKNLGFDKQVFSHYYQSSTMGSRDAFRNQLSNISGVNKVSFASNTPESISSVWDMRTGSTDDDWAPVYLARIDEYYLETCKVKLLEGRNFTKSSSIFRDDDDEGLTEYIINRPAMEKLGYTLENVLGQTIAVSEERGTVIGVVSDFHFANLKKEIEPLIFAYNPEDTWRVLVSMNENQAAEILPKIEEVFAELAPNYPFDYSFLSDSFEKRYRLESQLGTISSILSGIAIIVACLGLIGLTSFTTHQRSKEVSIRKVLGASIPDIIVLLSRELFWLLVVSIVLAIPLAWMYMDNWLNEYAFHIELSWWMALLPVTMIVLFTFSTVGYMLLRSANQNPANNLRSE
ncbi:FtsX-like permease family protein [Flammeovirgaceae bacterium SG7u.111]|nr:FtsX-like permease family protein [Flammeovirgaceae bacterium SG7u.132]WPO33617.1 FtsX-like permease family protein [Flammeovirgaceae bacterium SG7u.111]